MEEETIEKNQIDLRYQSFRLPDKRQENKLLNDISQTGIQHPLKGVMKENIFILMDGFKRYRVSMKLKIDILPISILASDEAEGMVKLIKAPDTRPLHFLEEVKLVTELYCVHKLSIREIAKKLNRSLGWVSSRRGLYDHFSNKTWNLIFTEKLPVSTLVDTFRMFRRLNKASKKKIDEFADIVAGKGLSFRSIEKLAHAWFSGNEDLKKQIKEGDLNWVVEKLEDTGLSGNEKELVKDLVIIKKYIERLTIKVTLISLSTLTEDSKMKAISLSRSIIAKQEGLMMTLNKLIGETP